MKLNKQQQSAVMLAHETYWESYLKGDVQSLASLLDDGYSQIGSVESEVFSNKKDAVNFVQTTIDQVAGKVEMRNRITKLEPGEEFILVTEQCDLYVFIEGEWNFYSKFRASSMMQPKEGAWKIIHQHSSIPDSKAQEGENIATQKIAAENLQLREAVKRRTVELEQKNRDLEIEASLERVRAVAMGMNKPDDMLDVCRIISAQLQLLNITHIRNIQTAIFYESRGIYLNYEYFSIADKTVITEVAYNLQSDVKEFVNKMQQDTEAFFTTSFEGAKLKEWMDYQEKANQYVDSNLHNAASLNYYFYSIGPGALGISTYAPLKEDHLLIFKRFRNVFELAYRRFNDIEQAAAQAKEAQIEASMERVRSRTMAMQKSAELGEVAVLLYNELKILGVTQQFFETGYVEIDEVNKIQTGWTTTPDGNYLEPFNLPLNGEPVLDARYEAWKQRVPVFKQLVSGEELKRTIEFTLPYMGNKEAEEITRNAPDAIIFYCGNFEHGYLSINSDTPLGAEAEAMLARFTRVFEQTYKRFLDLQKAEAQAREAQIEAALEKVRSRSLAMHKSDELKDVVAVVFEKLMELGFELEKGAAIILIFTKGSKDHLEWIADPSQTYVQCISIPYYENALLADILNGWENGTTYYSRAYSFDEKNDFFTYAFKYTDYKHIPAAIKETLLNAERYSYSIAFGKNAAIAVPDATGKIFSKEKEEILKRFAHVFEQAYIRFLDLQKAEAQAREAKIEAALEKVRSRSLAMHKSDELWEVIAVVFEKFQELKFSIDGAAFIATFIEGSRAFNCWLASDQNQSYPTILKLPYYDTPTLNDMWLAKEKELDFFSKIYPIEEKNPWLSYAFEHTDLKTITDEFKNWMLEQPFLTQSIALGKNSLIGIHFHHQKILSESEIDILKRFSKVFDQAYIRFLDLQKAEAQAREAKIEAALEKARSRTMGMQSSDELPEVANVLFLEVQALGIPAWSCGYNILAEDKKSATCFMSSEGTLQTPFNLRLFGEASFAEMGDFLRSENTMLIQELGNNALEEHYAYMKSFPDLKPTFDEIDKLGLSLPKYQINHLCKFAQGFLLFITYEKVPEAHDIFKRFTKVFEQTYTRFLDLQKAEAQARESQIELSLERVRSKTMAMQHSSELADAAMLLFQQMQPLNIPAWSTGYCTWEDNKQAANFWMSSEGVLQSPFKLPLTEEPVCIHYREAYLQGEAFYAAEYSGETLANMYAYMMGFPAVSNMWNRFMDEGTAPVFPTFQINHVVYFAQGFLLFVTHQHIPEAHDIFKRFGKVFEQTYTRFLDLQKAEAQARESQIQLALERVRARTMAMQRSDELPEVAALLFQQVKTLGVPQFHCGFNIFEIDDKECIWYPGSADGDILPPCKIPLTEHPVFMAFNESRKRGDELFVYEKEGEYQAGHYRYMLSLPVLGEILQNMLDAGIPFPTFQIDHLANFSHGNLLFITSEHFPEMHDTFKRFAKVFEQTYTRFLDLQKAEAQAREAQIEIGLERLRSRAMAMQHSEELKALIGTVFTELTKLDLVLTRCIIMIFEPQTKAARWWMVNSEAPSDPMSFFVKHHEHTPYLAYIKAWQEKKLKWQYNLQGPDKNDWDDFIFSETELSNLPDFVKAGMKAPERILLSASFNNFGCLNVASLEPLSDEHFEILLRFAKVFDLTYTRFNDLQKAEAQTKEAQVEAALERVRSRTMAMQRSDELQDASLLLFQQVRALGVPPFACGFNIWDADRKAATAWMGSIGGLQIPFKTDSSKDVYLPIYEAAQRGEQLYVVEQAGEALNAHYGYLATIPIFRDIILEGFKRNDISVPTFQIIHCAYFSQGYLMFISYEPVPFAYDIFKRFAKVFEQTYTRFLDLQKAEAQAKEAIKASSLDRVRAEIASMRTVDDLQRITPLIWHELTALGVPFIRCGVFIIDEALAHVQVYLSAPDGHSLAVLDLPFTSNTLTANAIDHWRKGLVYTEHWNKEDFISWTKSMMEQGQVQNPETYQGASKPPETLDLHFVPFSQGMLYAGNMEPLTTDEISLVKALAESFSIAYARYEDFKQLEKAKQHIESTLTELKATQSQLIQSEKMASLGQLTAGIAHEIQNPLNFVNNFSEVNTELIEELKGERQKAEGERNTQLEDELLNDLSANMEKINHHGKRADAIVKGMLQHSRSSTAEKEPTDINKLADEYLRLAYHGLRAKNKSFNATLKTDYDESIGKINIIPQDIGRVILNLINNAFYVVSERQKAESSKQKAEGNQYEPTVSVSTKRTGNLIELKVSDNGKGIPPKVLDKIFQPFFTTKPTGQGTGLGLSLSYDIVKAHGGEIKVETKEGKGTEFIIQLPINTTT